MTIVVVLQYAVPGYRCVPLLQALNGYQLEEEGEEEEGEEEGEGEAKTEGHTREQMDTVQTYVIVF